MTAKSVLIAPKACAPTCPPCYATVCRHIKNNKTSKFFFAKKNCGRLHLKNPLV